MRKLSRMAVLLLAALAWLGPYCALAANSPAKPAAPATRPAATTAPAASRPSSTRPAIPTRKQIEEEIRNNQKMFELFKAGKYSEAKTFLEGQLAKDPTDNLDWYNLACANCRLGKNDEALKALSSAVDNGFCDFRHIESDDDLTPIRKTDGYKKVLERKNECQAARAQRILEGLKKQFGDDYIREIDDDNKLVVATNVDRETLDCLRGRLKQQADALWKDLFTHKFEQYVTVVISKTDSSKMYGIGGVYNHSQRLLQAKTVGMTVTHEFTHALHAADQEALGQQHPIWIIEGLATLCESSAIEDGRLVPHANYRLNYLQRLVSQKKTVPFAEFFKYDQQKFMAQPQISYPQCRYIFMYLYSQDRLRKWYDLYTADYAKDPTGVKALEKVFDMKLADIEAGWLKWVAAAKAPPVGARPGSACLGVRLEPETDGVQITEIVPGSGADKAALKAGDVIVKIDGRDMIDPDDLMLCVSGHKVGDKIDVRFRRGEEYIDLKVSLGAMPAARTTRPTPSPKPTPKPTSKPTSTSMPQPQTTKEAA